MHGTTNIKFMKSNITKMHGQQHIKIFIAKQLKCVLLRSTNVFFVLEMVFMLQILQRVCRHKAWRVAWLLLDGSYKCSEYTVVDCRQWVALQLGDFAED